MSGHLLCLCIFTVAFKLDVIIQIKAKSFWLLFIMLKEVYFAVIYFVKLNKLL